MCAFSLGFKFGRFTHRVKLPLHFDGQEHLVFERNPNPAHCVYHELLIQNASDHRFSRLPALYVPHPSCQPMNPY